MPGLEMRRRKTAWLAFALLAMTGACGGGDDGPDGPACDTNEIPQLFEDRCGGAACHGGANPAASLDLVSPGVELRVANVPSSQCLGTLADPSNPTGSVLYSKLQEDVSCGARMPLTGDPLTDDQITCVRDWISGLVPPPPPDPDGGPACPDCLCTIGETRECYSGPSNTPGIGICKAGMQMCTPTPTGSTWGPCDGQVIPSPEQCSTADIDEDCDELTLSCEGREQWSFALTGKDMNQSARSVAVDSLDNVYLAGDFGGFEGSPASPEDDILGTLDLGGGTLTTTGPKDDVFLAKYDKNGNHLWSKSFGDSSNQTSTQVIVDNGDNVILLARAFGKINFGNTPDTLLDAEGTDDIVVAKFDKDGNHRWSKIFGGASGDRSERITTDAQGNVWLTGTFTGTANFGSGPFTSQGVRDLVIIKLDRLSGTPLFALQAGGGIADPSDPNDAGDDYGFGIDVDANGNVFVAGFFSNTMRIGNGPELTSAGRSDVFVAKLTNDGNHVWSKAFGGSDIDLAYDLKVDKQSGEVVITGFFKDSIDFGDGTISGAGSWDLFLAKFDNDGDHVFSRAYGDAQNQLDWGTFDRNSWTSLDLDATGNIYLGGPLVGRVQFGSSPITSAGGMDAFVAKFSPEGNHLFSKPFGTGGTEIALDVAATVSGHVILVGRFYTSALNFGLAGIARGVGGSTSGGDGFLARMATN